MALEGGRKRTKSEKVDVTVLLETACECACSPGAARPCVDQKQGLVSPARQQVCVCPGNEPSDDRKNEFKHWGKHSFSFDHFLQQGKLINIYWSKSEREGDVEGEGRRRQKGGDEERVDLLAEINTHGKTC